MKSKKIPPILDPMSGARMFYFDKKHKGVLFGDIRDEDHWLTNYKKLKIHPDKVMDARSIPYPDNSFHLVVLDPPHLIYCGKSSDMAKSYGVLDKAWHEDMRRIFNEAWRVLKPNGTLIFKWADKDVSLAELLYVLPQAPVFGDKKQANNKSGTNRYWLVFFKQKRQMTIDKEMKYQKTIYKEMEYQNPLPQREKLAEGVVGKYKWKVVSLGTHPCGYVSVPKKHPFYGKAYLEIDDKILVHGGLTSSGKMEGSPDFWFGWNYAHAEDYIYSSVIGDKRWTTQEIVEECLNVIQQFRSYEGEK